MASWCQRSTRRPKPLTRRLSPRLNVRACDLGRGRITQEQAEVRYEARFTGLIDVSRRGLVGLNTELTDDLIKEGFVREIISKMQMMRKEVDYGVTERVNFAATGDEEVLNILRDHAEHIADTVLIKELSYSEMDGDLTKEWDINGKPLTLTVKG